MEVKDVLQMTRGEGEDGYSKATIITKKIAVAVKPLIAESVHFLLEESRILLNVADLGCCAGPTTFTFMSTVVEAAESKCRGSGSTTPEIQFYLNDLPGNDFNTLFKELTEFLRLQKGSPPFVMGAPGSFHERIFPQNCMHLIHSSYSVHWLSRAPLLMTSEGLPLNKGNLYISSTSPPGVVKEAYLAQFQEDFTKFLKCRSKEMVVGARLVLTLHGRQTADPSSKKSCTPWELLSQAISSLVSEGIVEEEKLDALNVPYYIASSEEVQQIVDQEGSFMIKHVETIVLEYFGLEDDPWISGKRLARTIRSFSGPIIQHHFGEAVMDKLYNEKLARLVGEHLLKEQLKNSTHVLVLEKAILATKLP